MSPKFKAGDSWVARNAINGWQLSFVSTFASSFPIDSTIGGVSSTTLPTLAGQTLFATSTINGLGGFNAQRVPFQPVGNLDVGPSFATNARLAKNFSIGERIHVQLGFEATNVFNHFIVAGASPRQEQEYSLTKNNAGQSVLVPYPLYKQVLATPSPAGRHHGAARPGVSPYRVLTLLECRKSKPRARWTIRRARGVFERFSAENRVVR